MSEKILLIDGHSILNRAYYGLPNLTNWEGLHTNAVYGFLNIMTKVLEEEKPEYLAVAFDLHAPTFRHKMYDVSMWEKSRKFSRISKELLWKLKTAPAVISLIRRNLIFSTQCRRKHQNYEPATNFWCRLPEKR